MYVVALIALLSAANAQSCFTPSGLDANNLTGTASPDEAPIYRPCNTSQAVSMCCVLGNANASLNEQCVVGSNGQFLGLCFSPLTQAYTRESCTDSSWQGSECIKLFTDAPTNANQASSTNNSAGVPVTFCSASNTFCLGTSNSSCCDANQGLVLNANGTTSPIFAAKKANYLGTDLAVGLGGGGGVALVAGLLVWWGLREKRKRAMRDILLAKEAGVGGGGHAEGWYGRDFGADAGPVPGVDSQTRFAGYDARRTVMNPGRGMGRYYAGT